MESARGRRARDVYKRQAQDITAPFTLNREDSTITVPDGPGLGVEIDHAQLAAVTLRREGFGG